MAPYRRRHRPVRGRDGSYDFHIVACPGTFGFDSTATIDGTIQLQ